MDARSSADEVDWGGRLAILSTHAEWVRRDRTFVLAHLGRISWSAARTRRSADLAPGADQPRSRSVTITVYGVPGPDATSIAESEGVSPRSPDRSADARSDGHVLGPGVPATGKRLAAPAGSSPSAMIAAVPHPRPAPGARPAGLRAWRLTLPRRATSGC